MRASGLAAVLGAGFLLVAGCIDSTTTVDVRADGGGTVTEAVYVTRPMERMLTVLGTMSAALMQTKADAQGPLAGSREVFEKRAAAMGRGVTLVSVDTEKRRDGQNGTTAVYAFTDVNAIRVSVDPLYPVPTFGPVTNAARPAGAVTFEIPSGNRRELRVLIPWSEGARSSAAARRTSQPAARLPAEDIAILRHTLDGFRARFMVTTATPPISTTAMFVDTIPNKPSHRRVLLFDLCLGEVVRNEGYLEQLGALGPATDMADAVARYAGLPMVKIEQKPVVQIGF